MIFYSSSNVIRMIKLRKMRWAGHAERSGEKRNVSSLVGKHEGRRPFGRHTRRWKDNIKMYLSGNSMKGCGLLYFGSA